MLGAILKVGEPCQSQFNAGFLTHLYLIRTEHIVYTLAADGMSIDQSSSSIGIQAGAQISEFRIKPKTATFNETLTENPDGTAYAMSLSFPLKGTAADVTNWVHRNSKQRFVILTRDTLGNCYLIGSSDNGARISWTRQVGSQSSHLIALSLIGWHPALFIPTIDLDEIFPDREFDYSFDLSFS